MNDKKISKSDYILSLVPLITFSYPILIIIFAMNFPDIYFGKIFDNVIIRDLIGYAFMSFLTLVSVIGWIWKDRERNQKKYPKKQDYLKLGFSNKLLLLMLLDLGFFIIILILFSSTLDDSFEIVTNYWNLALGFIFIVIVKISVDIHNTGNVYDHLIQKFRDFWKEEK